LNDLLWGVRDIKISLNLRVIFNLKAEVIQVVE